MTQTLTMADLPARFASEYGERLFQNRPFYVSIGDGPRHGPFLFRNCPDRLVPIGERVAWAMLRKGILRPGGQTVWHPTYLQSQMKGYQPDPFHLADSVSLAPSC